MPRVVGIDHLVLSVSDFARSKVFYGKLLGFLGFRVLDEYAEMMGWTNGKTRLWIAQADAHGHKHRHRKGEVGFHHYAFELRSRRDVNDLGAFLKRENVRIADPPGEYYPGYYAVFFLDPDGMKLEGMKYGPAKPRARRKQTARPAKPRRKQN